jgi:hypothetical protein
MDRCSSVPFVLLAALLGLPTTARAQETSEVVPTPDTAGVATTPASAPASRRSPASVSAAETRSSASAATDESSGVEGREPLIAAPSTHAKYGLALRGRWISVPNWLLGVALAKSVPLSTYGYALEFYRRARVKSDPDATWEISVAVGYQNMSPSDGYWLGRGKTLAVDTDLVQFRNFSLITTDATFLWRQYFGRYFGVHYGAGLGLGVVRGKLLRTSAKCDPTTGQCQVIVSNTPVCDSQGHCNEAALVKSQGPGDAPGDGHRFQEQSVPSAVPVVNVLFGLDFPVPDAKGLEFRVEGGFYDAFFLGASAGYLF